MKVDAAEDSFPLPNTAEHLRHVGAVAIATVAMVTDGFTLVGQSDWSPACLLKYRKGYDKQVGVVCCHVRTLNLLFSNLYIFTERLHTLFYIRYK